LATALRKKGRSTFEIFGVQVDIRCTDPPEWLSLSEARVAMNSNFPIAQRKTSCLLRTIEYLGSPRSNSKGSKLKNTYSMPTTLNEDNP
jgi:hypothetical protein